jgi:spore coat polysaccharide biosynthesis protein SpsF
MSSARVPGKVLRPLAGRPLLQWLLERLAHAETLDLVVVATSEERTDDLVEEFCAARGVACFRGPLEDVAGRMLGAAREHDLDPIVRISGDSPLLDPRLVDRAVRLFREGGCSLVTNVAPRSFPTGQSVEVIARSALAWAAREGGAAEREHVTQPLYREADRFGVRNFSWDGPPGLRTTLDTPEDAELLERVAAGLPGDHWTCDVDDIAARVQEAQR